jgi:ATP/maltotriose-dependent transcriptional regulator MalT
MLREGERVANAANHLYSKVPVAIARGQLSLMRERPSDVVRMMEPVVVTCRENNFAGQTMRALTVLGLALTQDGRPADAVPLLEEAIALQEAADAFVDRARWTWALADALRRGGRLTDAEAAARRALDFARRSGERAQEACTLVVLGEIAADQGDVAVSEEHVEAARVHAEALGLLPLVAQCRLVRGILARRAGKEAAARDEIAAAAATFRAMDARYWAEQAEAELIALA